MTSLTRALTAPFRHLPPGGVPLTFADVAAAARSAYESRAGARQGGQGPLAELGDALVATFGLDHAFALCSGRAAMSLTLRAMHGLSPARDVVLLPAYTSYSVAAAVVHAGLRVGFYDLDPETLAPRQEDIESLLDEATLCVVVCHLYGIPVRMQALQDLCAEKGVMLFDDGAQAMGARVDGRPAGTFGDAGLFSLARGKIITAVDGGLVITANGALARRMAELAPHAALAAAAGPGPSASTGSASRSMNGGDARLLVKAAALWLCLDPHLYWLPASLPFLELGVSRFSPDFEEGPLRPLQATMALRGLARLDAINAGRAGIARELGQRMHHICGVRSVSPQPGAVPVHLRYPVLPVGGEWPGDLVPEVPRLGMVRSYPKSLQDLAPLAPYTVPGPDCPVARWLAATLITLPTHGAVTSDDMDAMMDALAGGAAGSGTDLYRRMADGSCPDAPGRPFPSSASTGHAASGITAGIASESPSSGGRV